MHVAATVQEYDVRVDAKKRVTIKGAAVNYFRVAHRADGTILLQPRVLADAPVPARTVRCIAKSIATMKAGKRSAPVDLKKLAKLKA